MGAPASSDVVGVPGHTQRPQAVCVAPHVCVQPVSSLPLGLSQERTWSSEHTGAGAPPFVEHAAIAVRANTASTEAKTREQARRDDSRE